jgi:oligoribonuclease
VQLEKLVWLDMEMTGLDPDQDTILELAAIVTDAALNVIAESPSLVVHQPEARLFVMDDWNQRHHGASGLIKAVRVSALDLLEAEDLMCQFLSQYMAPGISPLCGNSVCQDRQFMRRHMPKLASFFHYRQLDVTSLKMACRMWHKGHAPFDKGEVPHRALADIRLSIAECRYYQNILKTAL